MVWGFTILRMTLEEVDIMRNRIIAKTITSVLLISVLQACGEGNEGIIGTGIIETRINISGAAQKGPFILGSSILVNNLTASGDPSSKTTVTETKDNLGNFSFQLDEPAVVQLVASGYNFNELTGELSNSTLTLRAIYAVNSAENQKAYINVLTHLIQPRVIALIKSGKEASIAITQAQDELIKALQQVFPVKDRIAKFTDLDLFNTDKSNNLANAYLLALSASLYQMAASNSVGKDNVDAELSSSLNSLADDLGKDGTIENTSTLNALTEASQKIDPRQIESNLKLRSASISDPALEVANIDLVLDTDGDGIVNSEDQDANGDGRPDSETKDMFTRLLSDKGYFLKTIKQTSDNGYIAVGTVTTKDIEGSPFIGDALLLKLDKNGYQQFAKRIKLDEKLILVDVMDISNNEFLLLGIETKKNSAQNNEQIYVVHVLKVNLNAEIIWEKSFDNIDMGYIDFNQSKIYDSGEDYIVKTIHADRTFNPMSFPPILLKISPTLLKISANGELLWQYTLDKEVEDFVAINNLIENNDGSLDMIGTIYTSKEFPSYEDMSSVGYLPVFDSNDPDSEVITGFTNKIFTANLSSDGKIFAYNKLTIQTINQGDAYGFRLQDNSTILYTYGSQENSSSNLFRIDASSTIVWEKYVQSIRQRATSPIAVDDNHIAFFHRSTQGVFQYSLLDTDGEIVIDSKEIPRNPRQESGVNNSGSVGNVILTTDKGYLFSFRYDSGLGSAPLLVKTNDKGDTIGE